MKQFILKLFLTTAAVLLVLFAAKQWFFQDPGAVSVAPPAAQATGAVSGVIPAEEAGKHFGSEVTIEGVIAATHNSGRACFLNFDKNYRKSATAVIFAGDYPRFPKNPESYYYGRKLRVSGRVKEYKGRAEIIVNDPSQIVVMK